MKPKPKSKPRPKLLSHTRPTSHSNLSKPSLSSRATQQIITTHHNTHKLLSKAILDGDTAAQERLKRRIEVNGGLATYQLASTLGQSRLRGGDTSTVLVEWLDLKNEAHSGSHGGLGLGNGEAVRILEVGALSTRNALNIPGVTKVRRIDLRSQEPGIEKCDFMELPVDVQWEGGVGYDVVSLSLVINYVGDPRQRGRMLERVRRFLKQSVRDGREVSGDMALLPALFLVLPLSCVVNSRYLTETRLIEIMEFLGFAQVRVKRSAKLYYSLWTFTEDYEENPEKVFRKEELRSGKDRNNFCIVLDGDGIV